MKREAKLDLESLKKAGREAREHISTWMKWERQAAREISYIASSPDARKVLYNDYN